MNLDFEPEVWRKVKELQVSLQRLIWNRIAYKEEFVTKNSFVVFREYKQGVLANPRSQYWLKLIEDEIAHKIIGLKPGDFFSIDDFEIEIVETYRIRA